MFTAPLCNLGLSLASELDAHYESFSVSMQSCWWNVLAMHLSLCLVIWALFAPSRGAKKPSGAKASLSSSEDEPSSKPAADAKKEDSAVETVSEPAGDSSATPNRRVDGASGSAKGAFAANARSEAEIPEPLPELPRPWTVYQEKQLRMDPKLFFGIDVECAATGLRHDDRAPCRCAVVSWNGRTLLDVAIQVPGLVSPLTCVTSMTAEQIFYGYPLEEVREMVRDICGPRAILVGQSVEHDVKWLGLRRAVDYGSFLDIAQVFTCIPPGTKTLRMFSLEHAAAGLLGVRIQGEGHCPVEDARVSVKLLLDNGSTQARVDYARATLGNLFVGKQLGQRQRPPPRIDGVCMGKWSKLCTCSAEVKQDLRPAVPPAMQPFMPPPPPPPPPPAPTYLAGNQGGAGYYLQDALRSPVAAQASSSSTTVPAYSGYMPPPPPPPPY
jgi:RNA exonuclease 4